MKNNHNLPPGNMGLPWIGESSSLIFNPQRFSQKRHEKYGPVFKSQIFGNPTIYVSGGEACRFILDNENIYFQNELLPNIKKLVGKSTVSTQTGKTHRNRSNLLRKVFSNQYLSTQIPAIEDITQYYFDKWRSQGEFSWYSELRSYSFDIACKIFTGESQSSKLSNLFKIWGEGLFSFSPSLPWTKTGQAFKSRDKILPLIEEIINCRKQKNDIGQDALGILIQAKDEEGESLTTEEIKEQVLNLLFAGHGTLASALTSFCLLLIQHPDVLNKCILEQKQFDSLSFDTLDQMDYLNQVLKEVLRINPPVGGGFRKIIKDCTFNNYYFPRGWQVVYEISLTHQDQNLFPNPLSFDPERFSPKNLSLTDSNDYIPFGGGRRRCLGEKLANLEMSVFASKLIRNYSWELLPNQNLEMVVFPLPHPHDGLKVRFKKNSS